jgi:hypothetical protein
MRQNLDGILITNAYIRARKSNRGEKLVAKTKTSRKHSFGLQQNSYKATENYAGVLLLLLFLLLLLLLLLLT